MGGQEAHQKKQKKAMKLTKSPLNILTSPQNSSEKAINVEIFLMSSLTI